MDMLRLIKAVERFPCLYNLENKYYADTRKKEQAWQQIAEEMKCNVRQCKKMWGYNRDCFRRYTRRKSSSSAVKHWKYEEEMAFVLPFLKRRAKVFSVSDDDGDHDHDNEDSAGQPFEMSFDYQPAPAPPPPAPAPAAPRDDLDEFFASMAATVRSFPKKYRVIAKAGIFAAVSKVELDMLSEEDAESKRAGYSAILGCDSSNVTVLKSEAQLEVEERDPIEYN